MNKDFAAFARPRGGFRLVRVYVKDGPPLTWDQPWEGEYI